MSACSMAEFMRENRPVLAGVQPCADANRARRVGVFTVAIFWEVVGVFDRNPDGVGEADQHAGMVQCQPALVHLPHLFDSNTSPSARVTVAVPLTMLLSMILAFFVVSDFHA